VGGAVFERDKLEARPGRMPAASGTTALPTPKNRTDAGGFDSG
jgi:hypothetical protein